MPQVIAFLDRFFAIRARDSSARVEILGGITTFAAMAYIIVANPAILQFAQVDEAGNPLLPLGGLTVATLLAAAFGCLLMGLYANRPIAVAPYMGENAFIAFGLAAYHITWQERLGSVFLAGLLFLLLTLVHLRSWLATAIPKTLKHSFAVGIGLFLFFIGLYETGIITSAVEGRPATPPLVQNEKITKPAVPVRLGDWTDPKVQLALAGFVLTALLMHWRVRGAILLGIATIAGAGFVLGMAEPPTRVFAVPWDPAYRLDEIVLQLDIVGVLRLSFLPILFTLFLISFLDTLGTLFALGSAGKMLDDKGNLPDIEKPMLVDSLSCMFAALAGTSTSGAYIESATGIREGARTGLAAVTTGLLFAAALFFIPLVEPFQKLTFAYGPSLMIVGLLMFGAVRQLEMDDLTELAPAVVGIVLMVFTYNIANGLAAGLALYPLLKLASLRGKELHPGTILLGALCLLYYVFGLPH
ncbi:MAG: NCS2 family permease [Gemmataceae bacterium]|nr:NCS2 family permease [Gemmataceae bacterium]MCI0740985.1 NCS2 family permease [Gemmataceae bacterium]